MKPLITLILVASSLVNPVLAQQKADDHVAHHPAAAAPAADMADGEVLKIDKDAKKLTIKHGEVKSLGMPPMTMVYRVKGGVLLDKLKAGDKIRFAAEKSATGFVVTDIRAVP